MDSFIPRGVCLLVFTVLFLPDVRTQGGPVTPKKYYAVKGSSIELPCVAGAAGDTLTWVAPHEDRSLRSRSNTYIDKDDPDLVTRVIYSVAENDAGNFTCTDGHGNNSTVQLEVIELSVPVEIIAEIVDRYMVKVTWRAPTQNPEAVKGYAVYVKEVIGQAREVSFKVDAVAKPDGKETEEFVVKSLYPGATYAVEVSAMYLEGAADLDGAVEGPRSPEVTFTMPGPEALNDSPGQKIDSPPERVQAEPWLNNAIRVTWEPPRGVDLSTLDGFKVYYKGITKQNPPMGVVDVKTPGPYNQWQAVLVNLKTRVRYEIRVAAYSGATEGPSSSPVVFRHEGFNPEISVQAFPLSPDTVLLTVRTLGGQRLDKLRVLISDNSAVKWDKVKGYNARENYAVVSGLLPRSRYFFMVKARIDKKTRQVVTDVMTPHSALSPPYDVEVSAQTGHNVKVTWSHRGTTQPKGFVVKVEKRMPNGQYSPDIQQVVYNQNEAMIPDLREDNYRVKVAPFDLGGLGPASEPVEFKIAVTDMEETTPSQEQTGPYFIDFQPDKTEINFGSSVSLTCTAQGSPPPIVQWLIDGEPVGEPSGSTNKLVLEDVQRPVVLTCRATNPVDVIERSTRVEIRGDQTPARPHFVSPLPQMQMIDRGGEVRQICSATGVPNPAIVWYKDGEPVPFTPSFGTSEYYEENIQSSFTLTCRANNRYGIAESEMKVSIKEILTPPTFVGDMPRQIVKTQGERVDIPCTFQGEPTPQVTWYNGSFPMGPSSPQTNTLSIPSVQSSMTLRCIGQNHLRWADVVVQLLVRPREPSGGQSSEYSVSIRQIPLNESEVEVKWVVDQGNLKEIRMFVVNVMTEYGENVKYDRLYSNQRLLKLSSLTPGSKYTMNLKTYTSRGVVNDQTITIMPSADDANLAQTQPELFVEIVEIRDTTARVDFTFKPNSTYVSSYRLRVKDLEVGPIGNIIFDRNFPWDSPTINMENLKPKRQYEAIMDAIHRAGPALSTSVKFMTSETGGYGTPVSSSSSNSPPPPPPESTVPTTTATTPFTTTPSTTTPSTTTPTTTSTSTKVMITTTTMATTTMKLLPTTTTMKLLPTTTTPQPTTPTNTTAPTSTSAATSSSTTTTTTPSTTPMCRGDEYTLTVKEANKTPYKVDIKWTVDNGDLEMVKNFTIIIMFNGRKLLEHSVKPNQRLISISSLSPSTKYMVKLKVNGDNGVLAESNLLVLTHPANYVPDTSNPVLELEANEIRPDSATMDWTLVNIHPSQIRGYRLRVLDEGPGGYELLTQMMPADSQSLQIKMLPPKQKFYVILDAIGLDGSDMMTSSLPFQTPAEGECGIPVRSSSQEVDAASEPVALLETTPPQTQTEPPTTKTQPTKPVLDLVITAQGERSTRLDWTLLGVQHGQVNSYIVRVKSGKEGHVLLERNMPMFAPFFYVEGLITGRQFYIELDALAPSGLPVVRVGTLYTPGQTVTPHRASSAPTEDSPNPEPEPAGDGMVKPVLDLQIQPGQEPFSVLLNWTLSGENPTEPVGIYYLSIRDEQPGGQVLANTLLRPNVHEYLQKGLRDGARYVIDLRAESRNRQPIAGVKFAYLVPPSGYTVQPVQVSSKSDGGDSPPPGAHEPAPSHQLTIVQATPTGPSSMYLEWYDPASRTGAPTKVTMLRYAVYSDTTRSTHKIQFVPAGQRSVTLTGLEASTTYGFQVAAVVSGGQYVNWSSLVLKKTNDF